MYACRIGYISELVLGVHPHHADYLCNIPSSLHWTHRSEAAELCAVLGKLGAITYVKGDVICLSLDILVGPEGVVLLDRRKQAAPLRLVILIVGKRRYEIEAFRMFNVGERHLRDQQNNM